MKYVKIYPSLAEHIGEGFVWLQQPGLPARRIVKITRGDSRRSVFCEGLQLDRNFLHRYNQSPRSPIEKPDSSIVMSAWYREGLGGLETQREYPLEIAVANSIYGQIRAGLGHPEVVVRVAVKLGILSVALGVVSVVLAVRSVL